MSKLKHYFVALAGVLEPIGRVASTRFILIAPVLVFLAVFFVYPVMRLLYLSLFDPSLTLEHFIRAFTVPAYARVLFRTFWISAAVTFICFALAYPVSVLINNVSSRVRPRLLFMVLFPFWTSLLVRTFSWIVILQREGIANKMLQGLGIVDQPVTMLYNWFSVVVAMTHILLPFYIFPLIAVMMGINKNLTNAALSLGATPFKAFFKVFFPLSYSGIAAGGLLVFILSLGFFVTPALVGGISDIMLAELIDAQVRSVLNWNFASALSVILITVTLVLYFIAVRWFGLKKIWSGLQ